MDRRQFLVRAGAASAAIAGSAAVGALPFGAGTASATWDAVSRYKRLVPEIFAPLKSAPDFIDSVVIGSGFGGAISAYRLAKAGVDVAVLERGSRWPNHPTREIFANDAFPDGRGFWRRTQFTGVTGIPQSVDSFGGVLDATDFDGISVWRGAAVGGGSVVYTGVSIEPEKRFFDRVFAGTGVDHAEMHNVFYPRARTNLAVSPMPDDIYNSQAFHHSRAWDDHVRRAGYTPQKIDGIWRWSVVRDELAGRSRASATASLSNLGNSNGAKYDLGQNYLKWAEATGRATVYPGHEVLDIGQDAGGRYTIHVNKVAPTGEVLSTRTISCNRLFLAAGSVGTTELLLKAQATTMLKNLNEHVGHGWGTNGDAAIVRKFDFGGLTQGAPSRSRILDERGMPVTLENWYVPGLPADLGLIGSLGMVLDDTRGSFYYDRASAKMKLRWPGQREANEAMRAVNNRIAAATPFQSVGFAPFSPDVNTSFTAHPLGGAVIGKATDAYGRVVGHRGLYVMDGAAIPGSTGTVNPSLTIAALAERNIEAIISAAG
ncbi:GMC oxidoreductase [Williamsia sp. CHRR-6]|uniref:GMC oxidoreductase n=1 Tax=Williamsia sp. CHRR-6 TaxID=2835871 RepID=UPI001BD93A53|nr:GMC oxidoreductase [Williamsia sp. CHRR-6]MBT0567422.1 GMC family oxidoreductase [Williamsia sp. CHRR-6]